MVVEVGCITIITTTFYNVTSFRSPFEEGWSFQKLKKEGQNHPIVPYG